MATCPGFPGCLALPLENPQVIFAAPTTQYHLRNTYPSMIELVCLTIGESNCMTLVVYTHRDQAKCHVANA